MSGVSVAPGASALTVIPCGASSTASVLVRPTMPPLAVMYADRSASGWTSAAELTLMIRPPPAADHVARRDPAAPDVAEEVDVEQVAPVLLGRLEERLHQRPGRVVDPDVEPPVRLERRCGGALEVGRHPVSPTMWVDLPPRSATAACVAAPSSSERPTMSAPAVANASAIACPMPLEAPVMTAQRPVRSKGRLVTVSRGRGPADRRWLPTLPAAMGRFNGEGESAGS